MTMNDYGQLTLFILGFMAFGMVLHNVSEIVYWKVYDWRLKRQIEKENRNETR